MAISLVNLSVNNTATDVLSVTKPSGVVAGDVQIAWKVIDNTGDTFSISGTGQATWTALTGSPIQTTVDNQRIAAFIQVAGASEPAAYTLNTTNSGIGGIIAFRGVNTTTPQDVTNTAASSNSANASPWSINAATLTTTNAGCQLVMIVGDDTTSTGAVTHTAPVTPGTWTKHTEGNSGFNNYGVFSASQSSAGATGTVTALGVKAASTSGWAAFLVALRAAAGGGGGTTITAAQGSYTLTGQAAVLRAARKITCASGTYTLTGSAAQADYGVGAGTGTYTLTGQAASLKATRRIALVNGTYALTGQSAALRFGHKLIAVTGTYAFTGQAAQLSSNQHATLGANTGIFALTGQPAALIASRKINASTGSYTHSGQSAALSRIRMLAASFGTYTLSGQTAILSIEGAAIDETRMLRVTAPQSFVRARVRI